jgi:hypothetical protein
MKKTLLTTLLGFGLYGAQAQTTCNPNFPNLPTVTQYIIPDSTTNLMHACAGLAYDQVIYIKAPKDTTVGPPIVPISVSATVDSIVVNLDSLGLPSYLSVVAAPVVKAATATVPYNHLVLRGPGNDSIACVRISGLVPASTPAGTIPLTIKLLSRGTVPLGSIPLPSTVSSYKIVIDPAGSGVCNVAIKQLQNVNNVSITPNPTQGNAVLTCDVTSAFNGSISIVNAVGQTLYNRNINLNVGQQKVSLPTEGLAAGMYQVLVRQGNTQSTSKLIVQ